MTMNDWNGDGKNDFFDSYIEQKYLLGVNSNNSD